jgi:hypothetical protein
MGLSSISMLMHGLLAREIFSELQKAQVLRTAGERSRIALQYEAGVPPLNSVEILLQQQNREDC